MNMDGDHYGNSLENTMKNYDCGHHGGDVLRRRIWSQFEP
jgi:hypothetical protein